ncbi:MAG TPA: ATP-binding protein [Verrucomicrobiae bacterium]|jgi:two-component system phosphate regulon sensor histidine kinase PhoR
MWPLVVFLALVALVLLDAWWRERRRRRQQERARQEYTAEALRHQRLAYAQAQAQQQTLFNSMAEGVLIVGADGKIQLANQSLVRLFNLTGDIRGQTITAAFRMPELTELAGRVQTERSVSEVELAPPALEGRCLEVNAATVLNQDGLPQETIFMFHDLTRLKQLENTRKEFVANVSHELRTPLSMIKGFVETLLEGAKDDPEVATRFLRTIEKHTDRLTYLIEDLLTISRLESGQVLMNVQPVELRELIEKVRNDLAARAAEKNVALAMMVDAGLRARADGDRVEQVLFNLVDNAIKYGRAGGRVEIGGRTLPDGKVEVWVRDDGPGIPAEARSRVFERFYRVDRARSRDTGGTGLGLAIVKHIVQAHGGEVWVESEAGQGATFFFTLPKIESAPPSETAAQL